METYYFSSELHDDSKYDIPFRVIDPKRLQKHARAMQEESTYPGRVPLQGFYHAKIEKSSAEKRIRPASNSVGFVRRSRHHCPPKADFWRYDLDDDVSNGYEENNLDSRYDSDAQSASVERTVERKIQLRKGPPANTAKSLSMRKYGLLRRAVVDHIDLIKQNDGVWKVSQTYQAFRSLGEFMQRHNFDYRFLPDSQQDWLRDMVERVRRWNSSRDLPYSEFHLRHRAALQRRRRIASKLEDKLQQVVHHEPHHIRRETQRRSMERKKERSRQVAEVKEEERRSVRKVMEDKLRQLNAKQRPINVTKERPSSCVRNQPADELRNTEVSQQFIQKNEADRVPASSITKPIPAFEQQLAEVLNLMKAVQLAQTDNKARLAQLKVSGPDVERKTELNRMVDEAVVEVMDSVDMYIDRLLKQELRPVPRGPKT